MAQISKPGADFEIVERVIPEPAEGQLRQKALGPEFSILASQDMKLRASLMQWPPVFPSGRKGKHLVYTAPVTSELKR